MCSQSKCYESGEGVVAWLRRSRQKVTGLQGICTTSLFSGHFLVDLTTKAPQISRPLP